MKNRTRNERHVSLVQRVLVLLGAVLACQAHATFHTWKISEIYSSADGSVQFIELHESQGFNGENLLTGHFVQCVSGTMTNPFIFANSGSINYAGFDSVSYTNLPTDGVASLVRSGSAMVFSAVSSPVDFDGVSNSI